MTTNSLPSNTESFTIQPIIKDHLDCINSLLPLERKILDSARIIANSMRSGNKLIICGNGGSASDSQHLAAEFVGRYDIDRISLPAIALTADTAALTAISNDYGYLHVFGRQLEGIGMPHDCLLAISTSGKSPSIINCIKVAHSKRINVIGLTGKDGGEMKDLCDPCIIVPSMQTARIQEAHILICHILCDIVQREFVEA
jgi:D-sedoheptulose 7-phosphate isomerase